MINERKSMGLVFLRITTTPIAIHTLVSVLGVGELLSIILASLACPVCFGEGFN